MKLGSVLFSSLTLVACLPSGSAVIHGTSGSPGFVAQDAISEAEQSSGANFDDPVQPKQTELVIFIAGFADACGRFMDSPDNAGGTGLLLVISRTNSSTQPAAVAPGTYDIGSATDTNDVTTLVSVTSITTNSSCPSSQLLTLAKATSGSITISSISDEDDTAGSFSANFSTGTITGTFSAVHCYVGLSQQLIQTDICGG